VNETAASIDVVKEDGSKGRRQQEEDGSKRRTAAKGNAAYPVRVDGVTLRMSVSRALA
jgi:hypothetical protein